MRTRLSICAKKARFPSEQDALLAAERATPLILSPSKGPLRPYRCDRCRCFHLTSRTKGKRTHGRHAGGVADRPLVPRPVV